MQTKHTFRILSFTILMGILFSCEKNEDELIDHGLLTDTVENATIQSKSAPRYGEFRYGSKQAPTLRLPNSDWHYTIHYKIDRTNGEFIQPDGIMYLKGASVGSTVVITAERGVPAGWIQIDKFKEYDEFGQPEERKKYQYLVIKYQG